MLLHLDDPDGRYSAVRLCSDLPPLDYERANGEWRLELEPPVTRLEYLLEVVHADGGREHVCDPGNPRRAPGAFGDKSVLVLDDYARPEWLEADGVEGAVQDVAVWGAGIGAGIGVSIWSPADADPGEPLPLLAVHDGPEYDALSSLTHYAAVTIRRGELPRHRVALLAPGERNEWYSASALYSAALVRDVLPAIRRAVAVEGPVAGMGASLGGLAMLHAHRRHPGAFGALFMQSGSFFMPRYDAQESHFPRYTRIVRFVQEVLAARIDPTPVALTCGAAEENIHDNRSMAEALGVPLREVPDMHNYTAWRDSFAPDLARLLERAW